MADDKDLQTTSTLTQMSFLSLPAESRLPILELYFDFAVRRIFSKKHHKKYLTLLLANKQVYDETRAVAKDARVAQIQQSHQLYWIYQSQVLKTGTPTTVMPKWQFASAAHNLRCDPADEYWLTYQSYLKDGSRCFRA